MGYLCDLCLFTAVISPPKIALLITLLLAGFWSALHCALVEKEMPKNKRLLVVDDSRMSRMMISTIVEGHDTSWDIVHAASADEALAYSVGNAVDAITLDVNMPGRTGLEIIPELKQQQPGAHIAVISANIQKATTSAVYEFGLRFIAKPITEEKVKLFLKEAEVHCANA